MIDAIFEFFLGAEPDSILNPVAYHLYFIAKLIIGIMFLSLILNLFNIVKRFF